MKTGSAVDVKKYLITDKNVSYMTRKSVEHRSQGKNSHIDEETHIMMKSKSCY